MHLCSLSHWSDDDTLNEEDDQEGGKNALKKIVSTYIAQ